MRKLYWILILGFLFAACASNTRPKMDTTSITTPLGEDIDSQTPKPHSDSRPSTPEWEPGVKPQPFHSDSSELPPPGAEREFTTDFSKHSVPYSEILSGGPPKDGIPSIDAPKFHSTNEADEWLDDREPVVFVQVNDEAKAYPIQILIWHEIVNDTVGGEPMMVSFCPLCNTAIAFKRTFDGQVLDFGTTGRL